MHAEKNLEAKLKNVYYHSFPPHLPPINLIGIFLGELSSRGFFKDLALPKT